MPFGLYQHRTPPRGVFLGLTAVLGLGVLLFILPSSLPDRYIPADLVPFQQSPSSHLNHEPIQPTPSSRTKFLFNESRYPPPSAPFEQKPEQEPFFNFDVSPVKEEGMMVPNAVHYIWMLRASVEEVEASRQAGQPLSGSVFPYYAYLSVRSALLVLKPHRLYFHYDNLPTGPWFEALKPHLTLNQVPTPTRVYDQWLELSAHRADIMRIMALKALGGIYLDLDIYIVRPFDEFMYAPFTLGIEAYPGSSGAAKGLCNAVIISEVNATFLEPWMRSFMEFRHDLYEYNAIIKPWYIARFDHSLVQVVTHEAFFNPTWDENEITMVFETDEWDFDATGQCAYHAWHSVKPQYLSNLNPREVRKGGTSFTNLVKRYIGDEDEALWDSFGSR